MRKQYDKRASRARRHIRVRAKIAGTAARPRLNVYRSLQHIYAQVIDDESGQTLAAASTNEPAVRVQLDTRKKQEEAGLVGALVAQRAIEKGVKQVVFDRGGYIYHGRVKALAEAARGAGLEF